MTVKNIHMDKNLSYEVDFGDLDLRPWLSDILGHTIFSSF